MPIATLFESNLDSSVRWEHKYSRMAVEDTNNVQSMTSMKETCLGHLYICVVSLFVISIENIEIQCIRTKVLYVDLSCRISHTVQDLVSSFDVRECFSGELAHALDARSYHNQRTPVLVEVLFARLKVTCKQEMRKLATKVGDLTMFFPLPGN